MYVDACPDWTDFQEFQPVSKFHIKSSNPTPPAGLFPLIPLQWAEAGTRCIRVQLDKLIRSCC